jgi:hypothetical protein
MALQPRPELAQIYEYGPVGAEIDVGSAGPASCGGKASFIRVIREAVAPKPPATGNQLELYLANGTSTMLTTWVGWEMWVEFTSIGKNTTVIQVAVGWV